MPQGSRWTQYEEDFNRLPEGFHRIAYDADTRRYTFRDGKGVIYQGEPGADYGTMTPIPSTNTTFENTRPSAFNTGNSRRIRSSTMPLSQDIPKTFQDILPPDLITSSSLSGTPSQYDMSQKARSVFVQSVRRSALPKMQGVVHNLRRSVTSMRKAKARGPPQSSGLSAVDNSAADDCDPQDDTRRLMSFDSIAPSDVGLTRSSSIATARTDISSSSALTIRPVVHS